MFEGYIASKFANKYFEKEVFSIIKKHATVGALIMMIPDFGAGTIAFCIVLWHMYSKICDKCDISFKDNMAALIGVGVFVNIAIAFVIDLALSALFFLEPFIMYLQFYLSGKLFVESIKKLPLPKSEELIVQNHHKENVNSISIIESNILDEGTHTELEQNTCDSTFIPSQLNLDGETDLDVSNIINITTQKDLSEKAKPRILSITAAVLGVLAVIFFIIYFSRQKAQQTLNSSYETFSSIPEYLEKAPSSPTNGTNNIFEKRVNDAFYAIPDQKCVSSNAKIIMTKDLYEALKMAWEIPTASYDGPGDEDFLFYFLGGQDVGQIEAGSFINYSIIEKDCEHATVSVQYKLKEDGRVINYGDLSITMKLISTNGEWYLDDFADHNEYNMSIKAKCQSFIKRTLNGYLSGETIKQMKDSGQKQSTITEYNKEFESFFSSYPNWEKFK